MRVRGRLDWKVGVSVSRGKAAESLGDWVWRLGLAAHVEPAWGAAGSGCWLLEVGRRGRRVWPKHLNTCYNEGYSTTEAG